MIALQNLYRAFSLVIVSLLLGGCYLMQSASEPMPAERFDSGGQSSSLIVFLPGFADGPQDYVENGFIEAVRDANPAFDVVAANAHFGYYRNYSVIQRLHEDIIGPVSEGYDQIWLVGISMGGFGAAAYSMTYPRIVDGMILLAPYMGSPEVVGEVMSNGDLASWQAPDLATIADPKERRFYELWQFYREYALSPGRKPSLYLGFGDADHLRGPNAFVAGVLPPERSLVLPGGHKWVVWQPLFTELVNRAIGNSTLADAGD